uniref:(northern house mosquito) hypothetical protein n=1 Tax=Culex pipiens TaxID=7175 RepID=A0A8D8FC21_CULPI
MFIASEMKTHARKLHAHTHNQQHHKHSTFYLYNLNILALRCVYGRDLKPVPAGRTVARAQIKQIRVHLFCVPNRGETEDVEGFKPLSVHLISNLAVVAVS